MQSKDEDLAHKISDLTESLTRTTDVLSSADRMIDHYRDLNSEHEHVIARVNILCTVKVSNWKNFPETKHTSYFFTSFHIHETTKMNYPVVDYEFCIFFCLMWHSLIK